MDTTLRSTLPSGQASVSQTLPLLLLSNVDEESDFNWFKEDDVVEDNPVHLSLISSSKGAIGEDSSGTTTFLYCFIKNCFDGVVGVDGDIGVVVGVVPVDGGGVD